MMFYTTKYGFEKPEGELNTMILLAVSASKSLALDSFTCCHLNEGGTFWFLLVHSMVIRLI